MRKLKDVFFPGSLSSQEVDHVGYKTRPKRPRRSGCSSEGAWKEPMAQTMIELDAQVRRFLTESQTLQEQKNDLAQQIAMKRRAGEPADALVQQGQIVRERLAVLEEQVAKAKERLQAVLLAIPNMPCDDAVIGPDETANKELRKVGEKPTFTFTPKEHHVLGEELGLLDMSRAAKLSGARFGVMRGALARLERAIGQFMLDTHTREYGYAEMFIPVLVNANCMIGTGNLPKFAEDAFQTTEGQWLIPTAEVALTNLVREEIVQEADLPIRVTALTPCFRSEVGSAGKDMKGIFRQRQFEKVELVSITTPDQEISEHARMTEAAENILKKLGLHYRVVELCTGDMGFSARKTYDIEVWLPGQDRYREISSCSRCGDFQARRMNARYRPENRETKTEFVRTLNGSGLAVGRTLIAIMENYQEEDGSIRIPDALKPYMGGLEKITKK